MDNVLRLLRCSRSSSLVREYALVWDGLLRNPGNGMGLADCHVLHSVCCYGKSSSLAELNLTCNV